MLYRILAAMIAKGMTDGLGEKIVYFAQCGSLTEEEKVSLLTSVLEEEP